MPHATQIEIPASVDDAASYLHRLGHAVDWERAAIVAAFVEPDFGNGRSLLSAGYGVQLESASTFAKRGIYGLRSKNTVARYARAWLIFAGLERPIPGETVELPDLPFPSGALKPEEGLPPLPTAPPGEDEEARQRRLRITDTALALYNTKETLTTLVDSLDLNDAPAELLQLAMDVMDLLTQLFAFDKEDATA